MLNIDKILNRCKSYDYISFDIFDTLLKRDVYSPTDTFTIVELKYNVSNPGHTFGFAEKRIAAEKEARAASRFNEVTIDEIYDHINCSEELKQVLKRMELDVEASLLHVNYELKNLYEKCLDSGKSIYIVSDMYLPLDFIENILRREGIVGYKKLFLSSVYRTTKRSGELFRVMCEEEEIIPQSALHIGDSRYADFVGPKKIGMHSIHIPRKTKCVLYMDSPRRVTNLAERCLYSFINTRVAAFENRGARLGFEILGPIIYAYCCWLHHNLTSLDESSQIWFAARDMYLFKEAYNRIFPEDNSEYIYLSRKSLRPVYADSLEDITKSGDVFARGNYSLKEIIQFLGYSLSDIEIIAGANVDEKKYNIRMLNSYPEIVKALSEPKMVEQERKRAQLGELYLKQKGLFDNRIYFADVGWHGTTQLLLKTIQDRHAENSSIFGFYIGCLDGTNDKIGRENYKAFLFDENDDNWFKKGIILFESMILAPHGSTSGYFIENETVHPTLSEPEGKSPFIEAVQKGALEFVYSYSKSVLSESIQIENAPVSSAFERMTCEPQREELDAIGDLEYDNFYCNKMAAPNRLGHYIIHFRELKNDFKYSPWRIGFLYRMFKIRLPYAKLYSFARKKQGKQT